MTVSREDFELRAADDLFKHAGIRAAVAEQLPDGDPFLQSAAAHLVAQLRDRLPAELLEDAGRVILLVGLSMGGFLGALAQDGEEAPADHLVHIIACAGADLAGDDWAGEGR